MPLWSVDFQENFQAYAMDKEYWLHMQKNETGSWVGKKTLKNGLKTYWRSQVIKLLENIKKEARNIDLDNDVLDLRLKEWVP